ncbi:hypothetical protein Tco_1301238 [Tanacetum coccineum]
MSENHLIATSDSTHGGFNLNEDADDLDAEEEEVQEVRPMGRDRSKKKTSSSFVHSESSTANWSRESVKLVIRGHNIRFTVRDAFVESLLYDIISSTDAGSTHIQEFLMMLERYRANITIDQLGDCLAQL